MRLKLFAAAFAAGFTAFACGASAATVLETASYGETAGGGLAIGVVTPGILEAPGPILGARFSLSGTTQITSFGGHFATFSDGNVTNPGTLWIALIEMSGAFPSFDAADIESHALISAVIDDGFVSGSGAFNGADILASTDLLLDAGDYAIVVGGGGLFGSSGEGYAPTENQTVLPGASLFYWDARPFGQEWLEEPVTQAVRFVVNGETVSVVPISASLPLLAFGLGGLGLMVLRKRNAT